MEKDETDENTCTWRNGRNGKTCCENSWSERASSRCYDPKARNDEGDNIHYVVGNAHDMAFLENILNEKYDAILDFMVYKPEEFRDRYIKFLENTSQYVFLSSARVYADSPDALIEESSKRLLDTSKDQEFLQTNEYSLAKAREEDLLLKSDSQNWTIIRPYITYYDERLQLGVFEKETWLRRALAGKKIVFSRNIAENIQP